MSQFNCKWMKNGLLQSISRPGDPYETVYLTSLGRVRAPKGVDDTITWEEKDDQLLLTVTLTNTTAESVVLDNVRFYIQANTDFVQNQHITYHQRVMQHSCMCGHGAFLYWCRPSGEGPYLTMIATGDTSLVESFNEKIYQVRAARATLAPGAQKKYTFTLLWIEDHYAIQNALYDAGAVALDIFPGLTIPSDMELRLAPRCRQPIHGVSCPDADITWKRGICIVRFTDVGMKTIRISYGDGLETYVRCFATRPVEELIASRASHLVNHQRYTGDQWYDGLFSQWSMIHREMTTPDHRLDLHPYMISADDPGLCKAPYLAEKNVARPDAREIAAIEYYIEHFVWGGLQRTDKETPYPWGIYGSDEWKKNRESGTGYECGGIGMERMWRTFDYTHLIQLYFNMYLIARNYPDLVHYLDAEGYLERARKTALAFFEVPYSIYMRDYWSHWGYSDWAFKQGNFHERYILPLLDACQDETLRYYWETKCKYMIYDNPLPYGSEMWFDSTAFESTQAVAHYAMEHGLEPDVNGWYDKNLNGPGQGGYRSHPIVSKKKEEDFLHRQMTANLASRGSQVRDFYQLGSDFRAGGYKTYLLSYMSQMGGAAVLDYALYFDKTPWKTLRTGYASMLAPWCLVNLGEKDPFYPHPDNEGAVGWAWQQDDGGKTWAGFSCARGPWPYDGEIDSGLSGAVCASCSVLAEDPVFGLVCYGGHVEQKVDGLVIRLCDGVRRAFHALHELPRRLHVTIDRDAMAEIQIRQEAENWLCLQCENITGDAHTVTLTINGSVCHVQAPAKKKYSIVIAKEEGVACV